MIKYSNMNLIILGPQGSGKGTQARLLAQEFGLEYMEMGKLLRDVAKQDSALGKQVHERINLQGKLVDDEIIRQVLHEKLRAVPKEKGIIFDGVPRNVGQTEYINSTMKELDRNIDAVLDITIPETESVERLSKRRICKEKEHVLIMGKDVKSEEDKCPSDGSEIFQRLDDTPERIKTRLEIYRNATKAVTEHYREKGSLIEIDGRPGIEEVSKMIREKLNERGIG